MRMPGGLMLLPPQPRGGSAMPESSASFHSEVFDGHVGYLRLGSLNSANLKEMDKNLQDFVAKKVDAVIVDLRASSTGDFAIAAEFAKRFSLCANRPRAKTGRLVPIATRRFKV